MRLIPRKPKSQSLQKVQNSMRGLLYPRAVRFATFAKKAPFRMEASQDEFAPFFRWWGEAVPKDPQKSYFPSVERVFYIRGISCWRRRGRRCPDSEKLVCADTGIGSRLVPGFRKERIHGLLLLIVRKALRFLNKRRPEYPSIAKINKNENESIPPRTYFCFGLYETWEIFLDSFPWFEVWIADCDRLKKNTRQHRKYCWYCPRFSGAIFSFVRSGLNSFDRRSFACFSLISYFWNRFAP